MMEDDNDRARTPSERIGNPETTYARPIAIVMVTAPHGPSSTVQREREGLLQRGDRVPPQPEIYL